MSLTDPRRLICELDDFAKDLERTTVVHRAAFEESEAAQNSVTEHSYRLRSRVLRSQGVVDECRLKTDAVYSDLLFAQGRSDDAVVASRLANEHAQSALSAARYRHQQWTDEVASAEDELARATAELACARQREQACLTAVQRAQERWRLATEALERKREEISYDDDGSPVYPDTSAEEQEVELANSELLHAENNLRQAQQQRLEAEAWLIRAQKRLQRACEGVQIASQAVEIAEQAVAASRDAVAAAERGKELGESALVLMDQNKCTVRDARELSKKLFERCDLMFARTGEAQSFMFSANEWRDAAENDVVGGRANLNDRIEQLRVFNQRPDFSTIGG